jgi:WG containing repeat
MGRLSRTWWQWLSIWGATVLIVLSLAGVALPRSSSTQDYRWVKNSPWVGYSFSNGLARVSFPDPLKRQEQIGADRTSSSMVDLYGFIDRNGKLTIPPQLFGAKDFSEGLAPARPNYLKNYWQEKNRWGFIDKSGNFKIAPHFQQVERFSNGLAAVMENDRWGYIDRQGIYVIPPIFSQAESFKDGIACAVSYPNPENSLQGDSQYLNIKGEVIRKVSLKFIKDKNLAICEKSSEGLTPIFIGDKYGYMNRQGKVVIQPRFSIVFSFSEGLARVQASSAPNSRQDYKYGYINTKGKWVIAPQPQFIRAKEFHEGLAVVEKSLSRPRYPIDKSSLKLAGVDRHVCGYINRQGKFAIKLRLHSCNNFTEGLAMAAIEGSYNFIDKMGSVMIPGIVNHFPEPFSEGLARVSTNSTISTKYYYINQQGRITIEKLHL